MSDEVDSAFEEEYEEEESSVVYDDDKEPAKDYRVGGYHPVEIGDVFLNRYQVVQKLGWGHFSTVWLCRDTKFNTYVAMKVQKSAPNYTEAAYDEIDILLKVSKNYNNSLWVESLKSYMDCPVEDHLREYTYVVQLLNSFIHVGQNGKHICMVFEILGVNLLEIIKVYNFKGVPMPICRSITKQVLVGLDYLHRICGVIHTDLKPENVLLQLTTAQVNEIIEFGMLKNKIDMHPPARSVDTPFTPLTQELSELTEEELREKDKKERKKEKKKRYKKRKKQKEKALKAQADESTQEPAQKKKRKRNRKNKNPSITEEIHKLEAESNPVGSTQDTPTAKEEVVVNENIRVKIADLGNACWVDNHFSTEIQTRQYRGPEVMLGITYNHTADIWSLACMVFELVTGDFLFEPRGGPEFDKEDDHLAQMIETLGFFPKSMATAGSNCKKFFNKEGELRSIKQLRIWPLKNVLMEKYRIKEEEASALSSFLLPMLEYQPEKRITAQEALKHPWLYMPSNYDYYMNEKEYWELSLVQKQKEVLNSEKLARGETPSFEGIRMPSSATCTDIEDNDYLSESEISDKQEDEKGFVENTDYHEMFMAFQPLCT